MIIEASVVAQKFSQEELESEEYNVKRLIAEILKLPFESKEHDKSALTSLTPQKLDEFRQKLFDPSWTILKERDSLMLWKSKQKSFVGVMARSKAIINLPLSKSWPIFLFVFQKWQFVDTSIVNRSILEGSLEQGKLSLIIESNDRFFGVGYVVTSTLHRLGSPFTPRELITAHIMYSSNNERYLIMQSPSDLSRFPQKKGYVRAYQNCKYSSLFSDYIFNILKFQYQDFISKKLRQTKRKSFTFIMWN